MPQTFAIATHADRGKSWMLPEAKRIKVLIYASEGNINVYDYDTAKQVGSLTGFNNPDGQCVDKRGDAFLTTNIGSAGADLEYAHGGTSPIKTFSTDGGPLGCSI